MEDDSARHFATLCEQLLRNDPAVVEAKPFDLKAMKDSPETRKLRLHQYLLALKQNTIVTTIVLHLDQFLFENEIGSETAETTIDRLQPLLHFLRHGSSLAKVVLCGPVPSRAASRMPILQLLVDALSQNSTLQMFESNISKFSPELITSFLSAKPNIRRLAIAVDVTEASDIVVENTARAIASLAALEDLSIKTSATHLAPFLQMLQSSSSLCRLTLTTYSEGVVLPDLSLLPSVLESSRKLTGVSFKVMYIDVEQWQLMATGMQSNPNISSLSLDACKFSADAAELFLEDMASNNARQLPIRKLSMSKCTFDDIKLPDTVVARMVRQSRLHHIGLDHNFPSMIRRNLREFFQVLSKGDSALPLRSMELIGSYHDMLRHASLFLPTTVHLGRLTIKAAADDRRRGRVDVPTLFLSNLRRNGSLHRVKILGLQEGHVISKPAKRYIRACTKRNRNLPKALTALLKDDSSQLRAANDATPLPASFPTLSVSAMQAPQMAPTNVLIGLLASVKASIQRERKGKRVALQHEQRKSAKAVRFREE